MAEFKVVHVYNDGQGGPELETLLGRGYFIKCHHSLHGTPDVMSPMGTKHSGQRACVQYVLCKSTRETDGQ